MDAVHYTRNIYRGLNELLLTMICGGGGSTAWEYPEGVGAGAASAPPPVEEAEEDATRVEEQEELGEQVEG
jgi:hypothetical protein